MSRFSLRLSFVSLCVGVLIASSAGAAASVPSSPVGDRFSAWLEVIQDGDATKITNHYEDAFDTAFKSQVPLSSYNSLATQLGPALRGAEVAHIDVKSRHELDAFMQTGMGWLCISISVSTQPPNAINGLQARPTQKPAALSGEGDADSGAGADGADGGDAEGQAAAGTLQAMLDKAQNEAGFPGAAAVWMVDGKIVEQAVTGVRALGEDAPIKIKDRFHIGSVTKSMTGTVVARLVEQGKLAWDAKIGELAPELEMNEAYRGVTLRELLAHRAGVPTGLSVNQEEMDRWNGLSGSETEQRRLFLTEALKAEPIAEPGSAQNYSNVGYSLAGYLAETASGKTWSDLVRQSVFKPLKMSSAGFGWPFTDHDDQPMGHFAASPGELRVQKKGEYILGPFLDPAGDVHCSVLDLARYGKGHLDGLLGGKALMKPATMKALHETVADGDYSGGWVHTAAQDGEPVQWHNGTTGTYYAFVAIMPESNRLFAFVANAFPGAEAAATRIGRALRTRNAEGE